jgi:hypothetical protein
MKRCAVVENNAYSQQFPKVGQQCYRSDDSISIGWEYQAQTECHHETQVWNDLNAEAVQVSVFISFLTQLFKKFKSFNANYPALGMWSTKNPKHWDINYFVGLSMFFW